MTVVLAAKTPFDLTVVADTRVTFEGQPPVVDRGLLKLASISFGNTGFTIVVGFAGYLEPVNEVFIHVIYEKLWHYGRRLVMTEMGREIRKWIQELFPKLSPRSQMLLIRSEMLFCGFDIFRTPKKSFGAKSQFRPPPSGFIFSFKVRNSGVVVLNKHDNFCVLGEGSKEKTQIEQLVRHYLFSQPRSISNPADIVHQWGLSSDIGRIFQENPLLSVGAPYQCIQLAPYLGAREFCVWDDNEAPYNENRIDNEAVELIGINSGKKCSLISLRRWVEKNGAQGKI